MTEEEYKAEWQRGLHHSDYNDCRFSTDKIQYCKDWIELHCKHNGSYISEFAQIVCEQKLKIAVDKNYCKLCSIWSDKIATKTSLEQLGMSDLTIPVICSKYTKLTIDDLLKLDKNKQFIVKCNHGSGWNKIYSANVKNNILHEINAWQDLNYAYIAGYEAQYECIKPGFVIQPILCDKPIDYGFWYVHGELQAISLTKKFGKNLEEYLAFVKPDCTASNWCIGAKPEMRNLPVKFQNIVNTLKEYAQQLAKPFDFVRVDMLYVNSHPYLCETTFTPCAGRLEIVNIF